MELSSDLLSQFAKVTNNKREKTERTSYGTIIEKDGKTYVRLDGSDILTPAYTTVAMRNGERVVVMIKNHTAIVTGNLSSPAAMNSDVEKINFDANAASKVATDYIIADDEDDLIKFGDHQNECNTDLRIDGKSLRFYIKSAADVYKPYYEMGDSVNVMWYGSGFVSGTSYRVYFSIPLAKPVIGSTTPVVTSSSGIKIRQNGLYTHGSSSSTYAQPTYSATLTCDGGIVNVVATLSSTENAIAEDPCGITASLNIAFS